MILVSALLGKWFSSIKCESFFIVIKNLAAKLFHPWKASSNVINSDINACLIGGELDEAFSNNLLFMMVIIIIFELNTVVLMTSVFSISYKYFTCNGYSWKWTTWNLFLIMTAVKW